MKRLYRGVRVSSLPLPSLPLPSLPLPLTLPLPSLPLPLPLPLPLASAFAFAFAFHIKKSVKFIELLNFTEKKNRQKLLLLEYGF
jgi:hypothetical protein